MIKARLSRIYWKRIFVSIHHGNLQALAIEMFKYHSKISPEIMPEVLLVKEKRNCNLRKQTDFVISEVKSENYG